MDTRPSALATKIAGYPDASRDSGLHKNIPVALIPCPGLSNNSGYAVIPCPNAMRVERELRAVKGI